MDKMSYCIIDEKIKVTLPGYILWLSEEQFLPFRQILQDALFAWCEQSGKSLGRSQSECKM